MNEYNLKFKDLQKGERFRDRTTMWGLVKRSWCSAYYVDMDGHWKFVLPWEKVQRVSNFQNMPVHAPEMLQPLPQTDNKEQYSQQLSNDVIP